MRKTSLKPYAPLAAVLVLACVLALAAGAVASDVANDAAAPLAQTLTRPMAAGEVIGAKGQVIAMAQEGSRYLLPGEPVYPGDVLRTGESGWLDLYLADGTRVGMGADSTLRIMDFAYDDVAPQAGRAVLQADRGLFRVVSGMIGRQGVTGLSLRTPLSVWDVRGAEVFFSAGAAIEVGGVRTLHDGTRVLVTSQAGNQDLTHSHSFVFITPDKGVGKPAPLQQKVWEPFRTTIVLATVNVPRAARPESVAAQDGDAMLHTVAGRLAAETGALVARIDPYQPLRHNPQAAEATLARIGLYRQAGHMARHRLAEEEWESIRRNSGGI